MQRIAESCDLQVIVDACHAFVVRDEGGSMRHGADPPGDWSSDLAEMDQERLVNALANS